MNLNIFVLDADTGDYLNEKFKCSKFRNLDAAFKPVNIEKFVAANKNVLKILNEGKLCIAVPCKIFDILTKKRVIKEFLSILLNENCEVLSSTYYQTIFLDIEEFENQVFENIKKLESFGIEANGFFSPYPLPEECLSVLSSANFDYAIVDADVSAICKKGVVIIPKCCEVECNVIKYSELSEKSEFEEITKKTNTSVFPSEIVKTIENLHPCKSYNTCSESKSDKRLEAERALKRCKYYAKFYNISIWRRLQNMEVMKNIDENFSKFMEVISCYQLRCSRRMKSRVSALAMRTLPPEKAFYFPLSEKMAYDVEEFYDIINSCSESEVKDFLERNDFSKWIENVLYDKYLASQVSNCKNKSNVLNVLKRRIEFYHKRMQ